MPKTKHFDQLKGVVRTTEPFEMFDGLKKGYNKAVVLEWVTVVYLISVVVLMYFSMGSSQAMKAAWLEDMLSLIPAISFLVAAGIWNKKPNFKYPYGFHKVFSVAYFMGAFALLGMGLFIFYDSGMSLLKKEHPTIGSITLFGETFWMGYVMIAVLLWRPQGLFGRRLGI